MRIILTVSTATFLLLGNAVSSPAKLRTVKVEITSATLETPIEVAEQDLTEFSVFAGPGVRINGIEQTEGFIIDWRRGVAPSPAEGLMQYKVDFYGACSREASPGCRSEIPRWIYNVFYVYDPVAERGLVFLPGGENTRTILRGLEGDWFYETEAWRDFVRPLLP